MGKSIAAEDKFSQLRSQAENMLQNRPEETREPFELSTEETARLIHELRVHQVELEAQNEELCRAQLELEKLRDKYSDLYNFAPVGYFTLGEHGTIKEANLTTASYLGVERGNLIGKPLSRFIARDNQDIHYKFLLRILDNGGPQTVEIKMVKKDGTEFYTRHDCIVVEDEEENSKFIRTAVTDIQNRKKADEELKNYAESQEILVEEINHRVRNNLTSFISMLQMEKEKAKNAKMNSYLPLLEKFTGRIRGLSTTHNLLSSSEWRPLKLQPLCEQIIKSAVSGMQSPRTVDFYVSPSNVKVDGTQAHHLALVINELAFNSMKHAPASTDGCRIMVGIDEEWEKISIRFKDNGSGYPVEIIKGEFNPENTGIELIRGIVTHSLGGEVHFTNESGAVTILSF